MKKPIIAIDVDDVLAHSTEALRLRVNEKLGAKLEPHHYRVPGEYWGYYERVWAENGLGTALKLEELSPEMAIDQSHVPPHDSAPEVLRRMARNYDFVVITAREPSWEAATLKWIDLHFPHIFAKVIFGGRKGHGPVKTKGRLCLELGASWLIDDNPEHCLSATKNGVQVVLFGEYGWNHDAPEGMIRCKTWKEVEKFFNARRSR